MKFALTSILLAGTAISGALANPDADADAKWAKPKAWRYGTRCGVPGMSCKREADPAAVAEAEAEALKAWRYGTRCGVPGMSCRRSEEDADPRKYFNPVPEVSKRDPNAGSAGFCGLPGEACSRAKRSALALADAFAVADPSNAGFCGAVGMPCSKARRSIQEVGELAEDTYNLVQVGEHGYQGPDSTCGVHGEACGNKTKRDPDADPLKAWRYGTRCGVPGMSCKRDAEPKWAKLKAWRYGTRCGVPGMSCKRDATATEIAEENAKALKNTRCGGTGSVCARSADPDAAKWRRPKAWRYGTRCGVPGMSCRRDAMPSPRLENMRRSANPEAKALRYGTHCGVPGVPCKRDAMAMPNAAKWRKPKAWRYGTRCGVPGMSCKRSIEAENASAEFNDDQGGFCGIPGEPCVVTKREEKARSLSAFPPDSDSEAIATYARSLSTLDPDEFKNTCNQPGGECSALKKAHVAFHTIKREAEAAEAEDELVVRADYCDTHDCTAATRRWIEDAANGTDDAAEEERQCFAEDGDCTVAKRALDELEAALNKAVDDLEDDE